MTPDTVMIPETVLDLLHVLVEKLVDADKFDMELLFRTPDGVPLITSIVVEDESVVVYLD